MADYLRNPTHSTWRSGDGQTGSLHTELATLALMACWRCWQLTLHSRRFHRPGCPNRARSIRSLSRTRRPHPPSGQERGAATAATAMNTNATQPPSEPTNMMESMLVVEMKNAEDSVADAATRLAHKIEVAFNLARARTSELPVELRATMDRIPEGCNVGTFVEASLSACGVAGCGGPFEAAWLPAVVDKPETRVYQGAPDLLSQFVAASVA